MYYPSEFEPWRIRRDELALEMDRERLARRLRTAHPRPAKKPTRAARVQRGVHRVREIGRNVRVSHSEEARSGR